MLADSSLLYEHSVIMVKLRVCEKRCFLLVWLFDICGLQFGIVREVLLLLGFGSTVWRFALSWCIATFGFNFVALFLVCAQFVFDIWYLHLVFVNFWFFSFVSGWIWDLGLWECLYTNLYYLKFDIVKFFCHPQST